MPNTLVVTDAIVWWCRWYRDDEVDGRYAVCSLGDHDGGTLYQSSMNDRTHSRQNESRADDDVDDGDLDAQY